MAKVARPVMLMILDGWGVRVETEGNAIAQAKIPNYQKLWDSYPHTVLQTSGEAVGLPHGQMGNSEVGHLNIGAGRVVYQELTRVSKAIKDETFFANVELNAVIDKCKENKTTLHIMGLLSDGGVHSHIEHLYALLELAKRKNFTKVFIHIFLDGRDVLPAHALEYVVALETKLKENGFGAIATVMGRYYAMDRDKRWERVARAYKAMVEGEGLFATMAQVAVQQSYDIRETDEFVQPTVILDTEGKPVTTINNGDGMIFFNFRADRAREITRAFIDDDFTGFVREKYPKINFVCLTEYDVTIKNVKIAFAPQSFENTLGEVLSKAGLKQLRIAETEKYAHVTFFFNGGVEEPNQGEDRILVPSPHVATYNLKPEMSANEITEAVCKKITENIYDVIILNFANPDMVGHTGILISAIKAIEVVDVCIGKVIDALKGVNGTLLITSDHGNSEEMIDAKTHGIQTAHSTYPVPFILVDDMAKGKTLSEGGSLQDIAPTILKLINVEKPEQMTGNNLINA